MTGMPCVPQFVCHGKKFQIHRPPQFFSIDLLSKKRTLMLPTAVLRYVRIRRITILEFLDVMDYGPNQLAQQIVDQAYSRPRMPCVPQFVCHEKKKFQIHRPPQFFSIDLLSKKKNPDAAYGGTKICLDQMDYNPRVSRCYGLWSKLVCMSRKKNSKSAGHHKFLLLTYCQKKEP